LPDLQFYFQARPSCMDQRACACLSGVKQTTSAEGPARWYAAMPTPLHAHTAMAVRPGTSLLTKNQCLASSFNFSAGRAKPWCSQRWSWWS